MKLLATSFRYLLLGIAVFGLTQVHAGKPQNLNEGEMALIPSYCPDTMGFKYGDSTTNTSPKAKYWVGLMGLSFWHMHHYCWAMIHLKRVNLARTAAERKALRESAVGDIVYVVRNSPANFVLLPEILTTLGGVQVQLGDIGGAYDSYLQARRLKPDYWPAYADWAEVLIKSGQRVEAKAVVKAGLEQASDLGALQELYRKLGGDPAEVASVGKQPESQTTPAAVAPVAPASAAQPN